MNIKIKKSVLQDFIDKYLITDKINSVIWNFNNDVINCNFIDEQQVIVGYINYKYELKVNVKIGILDSVKINKLLDILDEDIEMLIQNNNNTSSILILFDKNSKIENSLRDLSLYKQLEEINDMPIANVSFLLNESLNNKICKSISTINHETFSLSAFDDELYFNFGDETTSSKVRISHKCDIKKEIMENTLKFNCKYLSKILTKYKNENILINIYEDGMFELKIENDVFNADYFLVSYN